MLASLLIYLIAIKQDTLAFLWNSQGSFMLKVKYIYETDGALCLYTLHFVSICEFLKAETDEMEQCPWKLYGAVQLLVQARHS